MSETLAEIFAKDPLKYNEQDTPTIIARMREARAQFELGVKPKVAERATPAKRAKKAEALLDQLGFSIKGEESDPKEDLKKLGLI